MTVLGIMAGSSMDGLDLAKVKFLLNEEGDALADWSLEQTQIIDYDEHVRNAISRSQVSEAQDLLTLNVDFARWSAEKLRPFTDGVDLVGFHGHTVYHYPKRGFSFQLGHGAVLAESLQRSVVVDFRVNDIAVGRAGAPMVSISEKYLWPGYDAYLNLGGICNISYFDQGALLGSYDIGPCNQLLNHIAGLESKPYDDGGQMGAEGIIRSDLLKAWYSNRYFERGEAEKSLDNSWIRDQIIPVLNDFNAYDTADKMRTAQQFVTDIIHQSCADIKGKLKKDNLRLLISGGGVHNSFLLSLIRSSLFLEVHTPSDQIIDFKEAVMIAHAACLRYWELPNFLPRDAKPPVSGGAIYLSKFW